MRVLVQGVLTHEILVLTLTRREGQVVQVSFVEVGIGGVWSLRRVIHKVY